MLLALFLLAVVMSAAFSGLETGLYTTSRLRLHLDADAGVRAASRARRLLADMPSLLTVLLVANNAANWGASLVAQLLLEHWQVASPELVGTLGVTVVLFLLAESVPKNAYRRAGEGLLYPTIGVLVVTHRLLRTLTLPISWCARLLSRAVTARIGSPRRPPSGRDPILASGTEEGFLTPFQATVARGILAMRSRRADDEALALERYPTTRVGVPGIRRPAESREHRVLLLDSGGSRVIGWIPMARLWEAGGFRAARRREARPVLAVDASASLDQVYLMLDHRRSPFAIVATPQGPGVLDAHRLRRRVMGTFGELASH